MIKENHNIDQDFKKSQSFIKLSPLKIILMRILKKYNYEYKVKNYKNFLDNVSAPEEIDKTFEEIDNDENSQDFKYKLSGMVTLSNKLLL